MPVSDIFSMTIQTTGPGVSRAGFGTPMVLGVNPAWAERIRYYATSSALAAGLPNGVNDPEYKAGLKIFAQNPRPKRVAVGRRETIPTQVFTIEVSTLANSTVYDMEFDEEEITYTSDASATKDEIVAALKTAIDALSLDVTVTNPGSVGSKTLVITADNAGDWFQCKVVNPALLKMTNSTADVDVEDDLDAIQTENGDWYAIVNLFNSEAEITPIAVWADANKKFFCAQTQDSDCATVAESGSATDAAHDAKAAAYGYTALVYHEDNGQFADAGWLGKWLPLTPGSETAAYKTLSSVAVSSHVTNNETYQTNLEAKNCNYYVTHKGLNITYPGKVAGGEWMDVVRFLDWFRARCEEGLLAVKTANAKVPFTDGGISQIQGVLLGVLKQGVAAGGFAADPAPVVTVPLAADVSAADKAARTLTGVEFSATLAGAIHAEEITGQVSV